jgi:hypothetical protein
MRGIALGSIPAKRARIVRNIRIVSYADCNEDKGKRENPREARCPVPDQIDADFNPSALSRSDPGLLSKSDPPER